MPRPGTEPTSPALEARSLNTGLPGKSLQFFWLLWVFVSAVRLSLVAVHRLLIVVTSLVVSEHGL